MTETKESPKELRRYMYLTGSSTTLIISFIIRLFFLYSILLIHIGQEKKKPAQEERVKFS